MTNSLSTQLPLVLVLHNIRSLHNIGAIFRSADGAGVAKIILSGLTAKPPRHEIEKTALGTTKTVPWEYEPNIIAALKRYKLEGYTLYALEQTPEAKPLYGTKINKPALLIVGHERMGIEESILTNTDIHLEIPMMGQGAHSLNVSNATAVALYEIQRQFCYHNINKG